MGIVTVTQAGGLATAVTFPPAAQGKPEAIIARGCASIVGASRTLPVDFLTQLWQPAIVQDQRRFYACFSAEVRESFTNATELRETHLPITENTEKKDVYLSPFHVNQLMTCEDKLFGSILRNMSS